MSQEARELEQTKSGRALTGGEDLSRYESDVVLRNGSTLRLRPIRPTDAAGLLELERGLSADSLYFRFFAALPPDPKRAASLARVDYENDFALVGETPQGIVAVAHFYRDRARPDRAEVAFAIADPLQGLGIGTALLERLAEVAREKGISSFRADVLPQNRRMLDVFFHCGFEASQRVEDGVSQVSISLARGLTHERAAGERARQAATASLKPFFEPATVAVVGAGRRRGKIGAEILHNLKDAGYTGRLVAVNPEASTVQSVPSFPRVTDIPGSVDLAVITVPAASVEPVVDDCLAKGVRALVIITAGFSETGAEGKRREAAIMEKVRAAGARLIGPNCMGLVNTDPKIRLNATFAPVYPPAGHVAMLSQSGALGLAILDYTSRLNLGISTFVSVGNKADVSGNDLIQYWEKDPRTDVILLYLESFGNPRHFARIARRVSREKPIVTVKAGRSQAGSRAASSHTGALAEADAMVGALLRQSGVIRTRTLEELFDVAALLAHQPLPSGRRVAIVTNAGGPGILAADACEAEGLKLATLCEKTRESLAAFLPASASLGNPVDMIASATADHYRRAMGLLLDDPGVDSLLAIFIPPLAGDTNSIAAAMVEGERGSHGKPVLAIFMSAKGAPPALAPIPSYAFPESAATSLARVAAYAEWRKRPPQALPVLEGLRVEEARALLARALARGGGWLTPEEAQELLGAYGIPVARAKIAGSLHEAAKAAAEIGFPVALKAVGPTILHKTEVGGVRLGITGASALRKAYRELEDGLGSAMTAVLVQEMVPGGVEVIVGGTYDASFGPLVLYGTGGTLVELFSDVSFRMPPLTEQDAADMIAETRGAALLAGYRGAPAADVAALRDLLLRVSALLEACPEVQEMDLNPVKARAQGVCVVDFRIRVGPPPARPRSRRVTY